MWLVSVTASLIAALFLATATQADSPRAKRVISTDFGDEWPLTVYSGAVNCLHGGHAIFIGGDGIYAMNGIAKGFAIQNGYLDIREISKPHPEFPEVEADIGPLLQRALEMC